MDTGANLQEEPMDRRSTKRRKPGSASSLDQDSSTKPTKLIKDDSELNCGHKPLTCDEIGYSNLPGGNGSFHSNLHTDPRQVHSFSHNIPSSLNANASDCPNEHSENDCNYDSEVYSYLDLGIEIDAKNDNAKSLENETRVAFDSRSGTGEITECKITEVKSPVSTALHNVNACNSTPSPKPPSLTELVRTMFSPHTADSFSKSMSNQSPPTTDQTENTDDKIGQENNTFLRDLVRNNRVTNAVLDNIYTSVTECASNISLMTTRMGEFEKFVEKTFKQYDARLEKNETVISEISHKADRASSAAHSVDIKIQSITAELRAPQCSPRWNWMSTIRLSKKRTKLD